MIFQFIFKFSFPFEKYYRNQTRYKCCQKPAT